MLKLNPPYFLAIIYKGMAGSPAAATILSSIKNVSSSKLSSFGNITLYYASSFVLWVASIDPYISYEVSKNELSFSKV